MFVGGRGAFAARKRRVHFREQPNKAEEAIGKRGTIGLIAVALVTALVIVGNLSRLETAERCRAVAAPNISYGPPRGEPLGSQGLRFVNRQEFIFQVGDLAGHDRFHIALDLHITKPGRFRVRLTGEDASADFVVPAAQVVSGRARLEVDVAGDEATIRLEPSAASFRETQALGGARFGQVTLNSQDAGLSLRSLAIDDGGERIAAARFVGALTTWWAKALVAGLLAVGLALAGRQQARLEGLGAAAARVLLAASPLWAGLLLAPQTASAPAVAFAATAALWTATRRSKPWRKRPRAGTVLVALSLGVAVAAAMAAGVLPKTVWIAPLVLTGAGAAWVVLAPRNTMRGYAVAMLALAVLTVGALEAAARFSVYEAQWRPAGVGRTFQTHDELFFVPEGLFSDGLGLRVEQVQFRSGPTGVAKPAGVTRVMVLGGSNAWGQNLPSNASTFSAELETCLNERTGRPVEVINAGVQGYELFQLWRFYELVAAAYAPEVVVLYLGRNDGAERFGPYTYRELWAMRQDGRLTDIESELDGTELPLPWIAAAQSVLRHARLYNGLVLAVTAGRAQATPDLATRFGALRNVNPPEDFAANLAAMIDTARAHGANVLVADEFDIGLVDVSPEAKPREIRRVMREVAAAKNAAYAPVGETLGARPDKADLVFSYDPVHLNRKGHRTVGRLLCERLLTAGLVR
jgi:lysophospholipase L1-like esterase